MNDVGVGTGDYFAEFYSTRTWRFYRELLARIVEESEPGPILDVGAGAGFVVEGATRWGLDCQGIEGSPEALELARGRCPGLRIRQHLLSEPFPFPSCSFQTVVMNQVLEHLPGATGRRAIHECYRVLRGGGVLIVTSPSRYNLREWKSDPTHVCLYAPSELAVLLESAGFVDLARFDYPLRVLGSGRLPAALATVLFKLTRWDRLSATANCVARKALEV